MYSSHQLAGYFYMIGMDQLIIKWFTYLQGARVVTVVFFFWLPLPLARFEGGVEHGEDREHGGVGEVGIWGVFLSESMF